MANTVDYKKILEAVKEIRKALTRRGHRPGYLTVILTPPGDPFLGSGEDMTLNDVRGLLQMGLRGLVPLEDSQFTHEVCVLLRSLKLPEQYAILARDNHTGKYGAWVNESNLVSAVGEAMFQVGRLVGLLDIREANARKSSGVPTPESGVRLTAKKPNLIVRLKNALTSKT